MFLSFFEDFDRLFGDMRKLSKGYLSKDLSELKDKGEYTEETETSGDLIIKRQRFKSFDGSTEIYRETSTNKGAEKYNRLYDLRKKINKLLRDEKYEDAIPLRDELHQLEEELKKPTKKLESSKQ